MKCGDKGHKTVTGQPCQQTIGADRPGCIWHASSPEKRRLVALKGGFASKARRLLPESYRVPEFSSRENVLRFLRDLAQRVLTQDVDPKRIDSARGAAAVALTAHGQETQERLVDALLKMEHGGTAFVLLERLQAGLAEGRRQPLPGMKQLASAPAAEGDGT